MKNKERISFLITGFGNNAKDYDFRVEDTASAPASTSRATSPSPGSTSSRSTRSSRSNPISPSTWRPARKNAGTTPTASPSPEASNSEALPWPPGRRHSRCLAARDSGGEHCQQWPSRLPKFTRLIEMMKNKLLELRSGAGQSRELWQGFASDGQATWPRHIAVTLCDISIVALTVQPESSVHRSPARNPVKILVDGIRIFATASRLRKTRVAP